MKLFVNQKLVGSVFRISGNDENALTAALAQCFVCSKSLLKAVLKDIGCKNLHSHSLESTEIFYQRHTEDKEKGVTDIEIKIPRRLHVVIEAKVGEAYPKLEQCRKYLSRLETNVIQRYLAVLLDAADVGIITEYQTKEPAFEVVLKPLLWANIYAKSQKILRMSINKNSVEHYLLSELCSFIEGEYYMRSFEEEVWIVPTGVKPLWENGISFYDIPVKYGVYFHPSKRSRRKSIYFAARAHGRIQHVQKILKVEYNKPPKQYFPELAKLPWSSNPHTIFHLGKPVNLPKSVKSGPMRNRLAYCDFDLLVNAQTVDQAQKNTIQRRKEKRF